MYCAAPPPSLLIEPLDDLTAVFHRASGITHLLAPPAPEILHALRTPATRDALSSRLNESFELPDTDGEALGARLDELVAAGLVVRA